ncbi:MAG TPA: M15 family metallopeptidase [Nannocystis sp.]
MRRLLPLGLLLACEPAASNDGAGHVPRNAAADPVPAATHDGPVSPNDSAARPHDIADRVPELPNDSPARPHDIADRVPEPPNDSPASPNNVLTPPARPVPGDSPRAPPDGFVDLRVVLPTACFAPGYAAPDNFTGAPLPGYAAPGAWMLAGPAAALARAQASLATAGLVLLIFDAYRPRRASEAMVAWAERTDQAALVRDGYIARRSGHNHGHTIDLGLARRGDCEPAGWLDMGTPWDTLDERSHTLRATGPARENRRTLLRAMRGAGFRPYPREWWHFGYPLAGTRPRDVPYGAREPDETP